MVVLVHEGCGAIQAALQVKHERVQQLSQIQILVDDILPALAGLDPDLPPAAQLAKAVERNVRWTVRTIMESPEGQARAVEGRVRLKRRSAVGMNQTMAGIMGVFQIFWIYYGLLIGSRPVIAWNIVAVVINLLSVAAYLRFAQRTS